MIGAVLLACLALILPFSIRAVRENRRLKAAATVVLLAHQVASALQVILNGLPTMKMDPFAFHRFATLGHGRLADEPYAQLLHLFYRTFGSSHLLGCQVSNVFFSLALVVFIKLLYDLDCGRIAPVLVLVFGLPLSCVFNTSVTLREAAQMAAFLSLAYVLFRLCRSGFEPLTLTIVPLFLALHSLHHGFTAALALILPLALGWALKARPAILVGLLMVSITASGFFLDDIVDRLSEESTAFDRVVSGDLDYVEGYSENVGVGRSDFGVRLDLGGPGALLKTGPVVFLYYLYSPLPWQVKGAMDLYGLFECFLRLGLTYFAFLGLLKSRGQERSELLLLLFVWLGMEAAWAAGTANWGTAFRHRLVAWGILVALGGKGWLLSRVQAGAGESRGQTQSADTSGGQESTGPVNATSVRAKRRALKQRRQQRRKQ